jgi:hypothetical protein
MKKLLFFLFLLGALGANGQELPKPTLYGIEDTFTTVVRLRDSVERASPMSFIKAKNAVVIGYVLIFSPTQGNGYSVALKGKHITNDVKALLKSASPGDRIHICRVKMIYLGKEVVTGECARYLLQ